MTEIYCSNCGVKNTKSNKFCTECKKVLKTEKIKYGKQIDSFKDLLTNENYEILCNTDFSEEAYNGILEEIRNKAFYSFEYDENKSALDNIINFASSYVHINKKHKGSVYGYYIANEINIDYRNPPSEIIATIIHELTHHIYSEIFEQWLMYTFNIEKNKYLEVFVSFCLAPPIARIENEYIAHSVEGQYILQGCQDYTSFHDLLNKNKIKIEKIFGNLTYANSVSDDISSIYDEMITESLRQEIIEQYINDKPEHNSGDISLEDVPKASVENKLDNMKLILQESFKEYLQDKKECTKFLNEWLEDF